MKTIVRHPGLILNDIIIEKGISQRNLASELNIAHSVLNNILKGSRPINVNIAISLGTVGINDADYWMQKQMKYSLFLAENDENVIENQKKISSWKEISEIVPISYFKKENLGITSSEDVGKIFEIYGVNNALELKAKVNDYNPRYFRKSSKFAQDKNNIKAWSVLAQYKANQIVGVNKFDKSKQDELTQKLKKVFCDNNKTEDKVTKILSDYGINFFVLDRPSKTPVEGKSFMSEKNPTIVLTLRYKRLDNFAFTLFHELGHVFLHFTNPDYINEEFFINSSEEVVEHEANIFAKNNLINPNLWNDFESNNHFFTDQIIKNFSKKIGVHPAIVRGRLCFEKPEYYRKRSAINATNVLR